MTGARRSSLKPDREILRLCGLLVISDDSFRESYVEVYQ